MWLRFMMLIAVEIYSLDNSIILVAGIIDDTMHRSHCCYTILREI